ncbi:MAG: hypothetical protein P9L92_11610 [Candidatus Electryonea clarkiae]|nr:hypothetical protein [Candidatus Electryonea clarkiae]MDP8285632.1 hypothetical protein [Candidatus Electryonea clarkiae]
MLNDSIRLITLQNLRKDIDILSFMRYGYLLFLITLITLLPIVSNGETHINETAPFFLLISPGARATGMGEAQTALVDPMSGHFNPGSMGIFSLDHNFAASHSYVDYLPAFKIDDLYFNYTSLFAGWTFYKEEGERTRQISIGIEYSRSFLNLGRVEVWNNEGDLIYQIEPWDKNESYALSVGLRHFIEMGVGYKSDAIKLHRADFHSYEENDQSAEAYDWGVLFRLPLNNALTEVFNYKPLESIKPFRVDIIPSYGYSNSNLGCDLQYNVPLPAIKRKGYGLEFRCELPDYHLFSFIYAQDFNKQKVHNVSKEWINTGGVGREVNFFNSFLYRWGNYYDTWGSLFNATSGFTIKSNGITNYLYTRSQKQGKSYGKFYKLIMTRTNINYSKSFWDAGEGHPVTNTEWIEFGISF